MDEEIMISETEEDYTKDKRRGIRRKRDNAKARRKSRISAYNGVDAYYSNLHQYSKNKVHCSCWLCSFHGATHQEMKAKAKEEYELSHDSEDA